MVSSDDASTASPFGTPEEAFSTMVEGRVGSEADNVGACNDAGDADTVGGDDVPAKVPILGSWPPSLATPSA
jgi:hypothetical protein